ncbi:hypothetical protein BC831DRAFT_477475 [Entophlyctis helioformis]|nr:hypothetical protein BC831DRAFT_477475 [Entophlyctis helioformis]
MLADFYETAEHEARILQESDHHPNVIRYFVKVRDCLWICVRVTVCVAWINSLA